MKYGSVKWQVTLVTSMQDQISVSEATDQWKVPNRESINNCKTVHTSIIVADALSRT